MRSAVCLTWLSSAALLALVTAAPAAAQQPPAASAAATPGAAQPAVSAAGAAVPSFDPVAATSAYLATVSREKRARSDAYFEGGYWLQLWNFLLGVAVNLGMLASGLSRRKRDRAERLVRIRPAQTLLYWCQYLLVTSVVLFPMAVYQGFFREHAYGLSNQTFAAWLADRGKGLAVGLLLGGLAVCALYAVVRRLERTWALWGALVAMGLVVFSALIGPVYIAPLFNDYTRLAEPEARERILAMARAQGVPAEDVYVFDASRQTKRVSANVSGLGRTLRISLNDNLLNRCSLAEIEAVMGHEMGHYVLNHVYKGMLFFLVVIVVGFRALRFGFERVAAARGAGWGIRGVADPAGLPLALALLSTYFFLLGPALRSWTRVAEAEADLFGINASGQAEGWAEVALMLGEYRKLAPTSLEEAIFFDHPSGRSRILMAMRWKAEQAAVAEANAAQAAAADVRRGWSRESAEAWARSHEPGARSANRPAAP